MANISSNKNLKNANKAKRDEFYTQLSDIEIDKLETISEIDVIAVRK